MSRGTSTYKKVNKLDSEVSKWFVIYTKYKTEKFVLEKLLKKGIKAYVPLIKYSKRYSRKIKHYEVPLINCYVFVNIKEEEYIKVLETEYVSAFLKIGGNLIDVKQEEMDILQKIVGQKDVVGEEIEFETGKNVEIFQGNLTGIKGRLVNKKGKNEFIVELDSIGYQFRMSINKNHLRPVN